MRVCPAPNGQSGLRVSTLHYCPGLCGGWGWGGGGEQSWTCTCPGPQLLREERVRAYLGGPGFPVTGTAVTLCPDVIS